MQSVQTVIQAKMIHVTSPLLIMSDASCVFIHRHIFKILLIGRIVNLCIISRSVSCVAQPNKVTQGQNYQTILYMLSHQNITAPSSTPNTTLHPCTHIYCIYCMFTKWTYHHAKITESLFLCWE